jgi:hypothetical protein
MPLNEMYSPDLPNPWKQEQCYMQEPVNITPTMICSEKMTECINTNSYRDVHNKCTQQLCVLSLRGISF